MDASAIGQEYNKTFCIPYSEAQNTRAVQLGEKTTYSEASANEIVPEETSSTISDGRNVQSENNLNIVAEDESKIVNAEPFREPRSRDVNEVQGGIAREEHGLGSRLLHKNIDPMESLHNSSSHNRSEAENSSITDNMLHGTCQRMLSDFSSVQQAPESVCATLKAQYSVCMMKCSQSSRYNFKVNLNANAQQENNGNHDNLSEEVKLLKYLIEKRREEFHDKRKLLEEHLSKAMEQKKELKKQITDQEKRLATTSRIMEDYEKIIAQLAERKERADEEFRARKEKLEADKQEIKKSIDNQEVIKEDLKLKYEKVTKNIIAYETRNRNFVQNLEDGKAALKVREESYEVMKSEAAYNLQRYNKELAVRNQIHQKEVAGLKGMIEHFQKSISTRKDLLAEAIRNKKELLEKYHQLIEELNPGPALNESQESGIHV